MRERKIAKIKEVKIIGNLPYYITTPIIMKLLEEGVEADENHRNDAERSCGQNQSGTGNQSIRSFIRGGAVLLRNQKAWSMYRKRYLYRSQKLTRRF